MSSMVITLLNSLLMYRLPGYRGALAVRFCAHHNINLGTIWLRKILHVHFCGHYRIILFDIELVHKMLASLDSYIRGGTILNHGHPC